MSGYGLVTTRLCRYVSFFNPQLSEISLVCILLFTSPVLAQSGIHWKGFGTAAVTVTDSETDYDKGFNRVPNYIGNSVLGLSGTAQLSPHWYTTFQLVGRGDTEDFSDAINWAQVTWQPGSNYSLSFGKQRNPVWLVSDHMDVGILYPWVKPPTEVYTWLPVANFMGAKADVNLDLFSDWSLNIKVLGGASKVNFKIAGLHIEGEPRDVLAGVLQLKNDHFTIQTAMATAIFNGTAFIRGTQDTDHDGIPLTPDVPMAYTIEMPFNMERVTFMNFGFKWDWQKVFSDG
jgi:hypothetical protein